MNSLSALHSDGDKHDFNTTQRIEQEAKRLIVLWESQSGIPDGPNRSEVHAKIVEAAYDAARFVVMHEITLRGNPAFARSIADKLAPRAALERRKSQRALDMDALTGLPGRLAFQKALPNATADPACVVVSIDVNRFGTINKVRCNAAGDAFLVALASVLKSVATEYKARVFRVGGDEFYFFTSEQKAGEVISAAEQGLAERLAGDEPFTIMGEDGKISSYPSAWFSHLSLSSAIGPTRDEADAAMQERKAREKANLQG